MIWTRGEIVPDDALKISVQDRTFEHGLGLMETTRTWSGVAVLLDRHLARMTRSANLLGIPIEPRSLPDADAAADLVLASGLGPDVVLRITASGGGPGPSTVWMRSAPLSDPRSPRGVTDSPRAGLRVCVERSTARLNDPLAGHKTLNYWGKRILHEWAWWHGFDEALLTSRDDKAWEGSRSNLFVVRRGILVTPPLVSNEFKLGTPVLPGVMRALVLERAEALGLSAREESFGINAVKRSDEVFLTNAVRGIMPVAELDGRDFEAPGPITVRLKEDVSGWLARGGRDE